MPRHYQASVNQVAPTLAALKTGTATNLCPVSAPGLPPRFSQTESHLSQVRPTLAALAISTTFLAFVPPPAQPQRFARPDFVSQVRPTLAALPAPAGSGLVPTSAPGLPSSYKQADAFVAPPKFGVVVAIVAPLAGFQGELAMTGKVFRFVVPEGFVNQIGPTLAALPAPAASGLSPISAPGLPPRYMPADAFVAPSKVLPASFIGNWFSTDAKPAVLPGYAPSPNFTAPDKVLPFENVTLDKWNPAQPPAFYMARSARADNSAAPVFIPTQQLASLPSWLADAPTSARRLGFMSTSMAAPVLPTPAVVAPNTLDKWNQPQPLPRYAGKFSQASFAAPDKVFLVAGTLCATSGAMRPALIALTGAMRPGLASTSGAMRPALVATFGRLVRC